MSGRAEEDVRGAEGMWPHFYGRNQQVCVGEVWTAGCQGWTLFVLLSCFLLEKSTGERERE